MKIDDKLYNDIFSEDEPSTKGNKSFVSDEVQKVKLNSSVASLSLFDWANSIIVAIVAVVILLTFCFRLINVDGTSMESTLINRDKVIVTELFYTPENGDIVVISHGEEYDKPLVKRVIATEGQTLNIDFDNNKVYVDGELVDEPYIQGETIRGDAEIPEVIPEGKVFVLGDNRPISLDSRYHEVGLIDVDSIIGKAQFVIIPHSYKEGSLKPVLDLTKIRYIYN
ncbi:MAG: signal peptidase I [Ruminococcus sp.]|nr:signal peptidase I [Ruminococcus sp.]